MLARGAERTHGNRTNENDDVIVHTEDGDFGTLRIWMDWNAVTINGLRAWKGAANYACSF